MRLPLEIEPCPIIDTAVEIRFDTHIHESAVFGVIYDILKDEFPKVEELPILNLPTNIRNTDEFLLYRPHYKISNDSFLIQIGPKVLSINCHKDYTGWKIYFNLISKVLSKTSIQKIVKQVIRLGIRYTNFFQDTNIFNNINLDIKLNNNCVGNKKTNIRTEIEQNGFNSLLQIFNYVSINKPNEKKLYGSIIDIDTVANGKIENFFANYKEIITKGHNYEKELFFSLLKEKFLKELNPIYNDTDK